jgi:hypothetical protein
MELGGTERLDGAHAGDPRAGGERRQVAGPTSSLLNMGCSPLLQPIGKPVSPLAGEPPTGEPCAGEPHARFGGRGPRATGVPYPYYRHASGRRPQPAGSRPRTDRGPLVRIGPVPLARRPGEGAPSPAAPPQPSGRVLSPLRPPSSLRHLPLPFRAQRPCTHPSVTPGRPGFLHAGEALIYS